MGSLVSSVLDVFGVGPASTAADATTEAANTAAESARYSADIQRKMFDKQIELQEPWRQAGMGALNKLIDASNYTPFTMDQFKSDPGYQFRLNEGMKALNNQAAARGGLISGNALRAAMQYGQDMGSQEYTNAFNRYQLERNTRLNPLQTLAGIGQSTANNVAGYAGNYGTNAANLAMTGGANQANALLAGGNIRASSYGNYGRGLNEALNTDWGKIGDKVSGWFGGGAGTPSTSDVSAMGDFSDYLFGA